MPKVVGYVHGGSRSNQYRGMFTLPHLLAVQPVEGDCKYSSKQSPAISAQPTTIPRGGHIKAPAVHTGLPGRVSGPGRPRCYWPNTWSH